MNKDTLKKEEKKLKLKNTILITPDNDFFVALSKGEFLKEGWGIEVDGNIFFSPTKRELLVLRKVLNVMFMLRRWRKI